MKRIIFLLIVWVGSLVLNAQSGVSVPKPAAITFSIPAGFYPQSVSVLLGSDGGEIFYTTDGSKPTEQSNRFRGQPIVLEKTAVLRAFTKKGNLKSKTIAQTYFINEPSTKLPIVSVAINPSILFNADKGIMRDGAGVNNALENKPGANFWTQKEFACNVEIFESDKSAVHNSMAGFRLFGGYSRVFPQKSVVLIARKRYGKKAFKHAIFGEDGGKKYKYLVLRNGGSDWNGAHFRDELMAELTQGWDIEKQLYRPALLYLNGKYWGIYHIREKINPHFLEDKTDVDRDSVDLLEHRQTVKAGSFRQYQKLLNYLNTHDLSDPKAYSTVQGMMDVENYMDYQIAQIYCDNTDAGGNVRFWRPRQAGGKWRWILFDTDWGFGLHNPAAYRRNSLEFFTEPNGPEWPNPPWSTFLLRKLLENETFKKQFVNRFCDRLNTSFSPENTAKAVHKLEKILLPEINRHLDRWNQSEQVWTKNVETVFNFGQKRADYIIKFLQERFDCGVLSPLQIEAEPGGTVWVNECIDVHQRPFLGNYFSKIPVSVQAVPDYGYKFAGWEGATSKNRNLRFFLLSDGSTRLKARFEPTVNAAHDLVFFNEICPVNKETGDWMELYNAGSKPVIMDGWVITDYKKMYNLPPFTLLPEEFLVVAQDTAAFRKKFPQVKHLIGNLSLGLDKSLERLALFAADGSSVDSIYYHFEPFDQTFTIDLLLPSLDNSKNYNWATHLGPGSPGEPNPFYVAKVISSQKDYWLRAGLGFGLLLILLISVWKRNILQILREKLKNIAFPNK